MGFAALCGKECVRAPILLKSASPRGVHDCYHAWGDDPLGQVVCFSLEEVRAAAEEAHRNGLKVSAHAIGDAAVQLAFDGGIDIIEHGYGITQTTRARIIETQTPVVTTLSQIHFHRHANDPFNYPAWEGRFMNAIGNSCRAISSLGSKRALGSVWEQTL